MSLASMTALRDSLDVWIQDLDLDESASVGSLESHLLRLLVRDAGFL